MKKFLSFLFILFIFHLPSSIFHLPSCYADSWAERPDTGFHAHPLNEIAISSRTFARGEILKVLRKSTPHQSGMLKVIIGSGLHRGKVVYAKNYTIIKEEERINVILSYFDGNEPKNVLIDDYDRTSVVIILIIIFVSLVMLLGGKKSIYSLLVLVAAILIVKFLYIPKILAGYSLLLYTLMTVVALVTLTIVSIAGFSKKSFTAIVGALSGLISVFFISYFIYKIANISGFYLQEFQLLNYFNEKPLCFYRNFLLAILIIGASGVIMDVAITVASSMQEITFHNPGISIKNLYTNGMAVGKDVVSTMANTLIVAYMGISLGNILIKSLHISSYFQLVNTEFIHVVFYQAILGSAGYLICILVTSFIGSIVIRKHRVSQFDN